MSWNFEVSSWVTSAAGGSRYESAYAGNSLFGAVAAMWHLRKQGAACIRLEWRP